MDGGQQTVGVQNRPFVFVFRCCQRMFADVNVLEAEVVVGSKSRVTVNQWSGPTYGVRMGPAPASNEASCRSLSHQYSLTRVCNGTRKEYSEEKKISVCLESGTDKIPYFRAQNSDRFRAEIP